MVVIVGTRRRHIIIGRMAGLSLGSSTEGGPERPRQRYPEPPLGHPGGGGSGSWGRGGGRRRALLVVRVVGGQLEAADGAGAVEVEPREDAVLVEDVLAR